MINIMAMSMHDCLLWCMQQSDRQSLCQPKLSVVLAVSSHDLHTWMTSSYMTYKTRYTLRLRHVSHPDKKGHGITGVHACNTNTHTHAQTHRHKCHQQSRKIHVCAWSQTTTCLFTCHRSGSHRTHPVNERALKWLQSHVIKTISAYRTQNGLMQYRQMETSIGKNNTKSDVLQQIKNNVSFIFNRIEMNFR